MSAPAVAVSTTGNKFAAAWKDVRMGEPNVYWTMSDKPEFAAGQLVHDVTNGTQDHPSLCIDRLGIAWIAWEDNRSGHQEIWVRTSQDGDIGRRLVQPVDATASYPTIATGHNMVAVVYESHVNGIKTIQFQTISTMR